MIGSPPGGSPSGGNNPSGEIKRSGRRAAVLAVLVTVQALAMVFFVLDVIADAIFVGLDGHTLTEAAASLALAVGLAFGAMETRRTIERARRAERAAAVASGLLGTLIDDYFARWELTPAEAEVALFCIKGYDASEIARLRSSAPGTVRAQLTRVYAKAGVSSRSQLVSLFLEDLLGGPIAPSQTGDAQAEVSPNER